ncbi:MAG: metal transporter [Spirochaetales bacterium]|nr:metal transporter [Spirochaetales bacterium]
MRKAISGVVPVMLLAIPVVIILVSNNPIPFSQSVIVEDRPPIEELIIQKIRLAPNLIKLTVVNDGPDPVEVRQLLVNGGYWAFDIAPKGPIRRLESAAIHIEYPWNTGDDQHITIVTSTGVTFDVTVPAAVESPTFDLRYTGFLAFVGFLIGVVPVLIGLLWFPFIRSLKSSWHGFFLALTVGLLVFLGVDSIQEALELVSESPNSLNGVGVLVLGFSFSFLALFYVSRGRSSAREQKDNKTKHRLIAFSAALGIGIHNLGEGLAVGSAFALGNISLGATLIVGFMIHNVTEGLPIVTPVAKDKAKATFLAGLGLLAGGPAIIGTWIGGYAFLPILGVLFLGLGAGAIFQVAFEIAAYLARESINRLFSSHAVAGYLAGLVVMYATGLIIAG